MRKSLLLFSLMLCFVFIGSQLLAQAANDNLCDAFTIEINETCSEPKQIDLANATVEIGEEIISPSCTDGDTILTSTVWFSFVAPADEIYILADADDNSNARLAYQMQLFRLNGDCADISNLELEACSTPLTNLLESPAIQTTLTEGETYYVQISGKNFPGIGIFESTGCLRINTVIAPPNDNVCNAIPLIVDDIPQVFTNLGAGTEDGEAAIAPPPSPPTDPLGFESGSWAAGTNFLDHSVWFTFTTPAEGGSFNVDLSSSFALAGNFNTQVAVYEATDCNDFSTFNLLGAADNALPVGDFGAISVSPNLDLFCLEGNKTYYIAVDGGSSFFFQPIPSQGFFSIQVQEKELEPLGANFLIESPTCVGDENGSLLVGALGGAGEYSYRWNTGDSTNNFTENFAAGTYILTITDQCGDQIVETVEVPASSREGLSIATAASGATCEGDELSLEVMASEGLPIEEQRVFFQTSSARALTKMKLENTTSKEIVAEDQTILFLEFEFVEDQLYATDIDANFHTINTEDGTNQLIDTLDIGVIAGLSYVPSTATLYCMNREGKIYTLDPMTAALEEVLDLAISIATAAIDLDGNIIILGTDGNWYTSSFDTGTLNNIGFFGANTLPVTALEVDPNTGKVYYSVSRVLARNTSSQAWQAITELNITNGESTRVLNSFSSRFSALAIRASDIAPYEYEWMPAESFDDPTLASQTTILEETTTFMVSTTDACETVTEEIMVEALPSVEVTIDTSILTGETYNGILIETDTTIIETIATETSCEIRTVNIMVIISSTDQTWADHIIKISPNPTRGLLNVLTLGIEERTVEFRIVDIHGRTLWQQSRQNLQEEIDVSDFKSGLYFLEIRTAEKFAVRQFVKL